MAVGTTSFPAALDTQESLIEVKDLAQTTLTSDITAVATTLLVVSTTGFPNASAVTIAGEHIRYTGKTSNSFTGCTRGQFTADGGLAAAPHTSGNAVELLNISASHRVQNDAIIAVETKLGQGADVPASGEFLKGTGAGNSGWSALTSGEVTTALGFTPADTTTVEERARDALGTALVAGSNMTITPNDGSDQITLAAAGNVVGQASSVDSEICLFSGTDGKTIKRATGTGFVNVSSGVWQTPVGSTGTGNVVRETSPTIVTPVIDSLISAQHDHTTGAEGGQITADAFSSFQMSDSVFRVRDNADATKLLAFELSGITTGTTRTVTIPNKSGTLAMTDDIPPPPTITERAGSAASIPANSGGQAQAFCEAGEVSIGGGFQASSSVMSVHRSRRIGTDGWEAGVRNSEGVTRSVTAYVICMTTS